MRIELGWPPKELLPNNTSHWAIKARKKKKYRLECKLLMIATEPNLNFTLTFCPPDNRKRDKDSMIAAFKAGQDGIADAWGIDDNLFKPNYIYEKPVKHGKIIINL